jgi:hypothetical protein
MYLLNNEVDKTYLKWHFILISNMAQEEVRYGSMVYCPTKGLTQDTQNWLRSPMPEGGEP